MGLAVNQSCLKDREGSVMLVPFVLVMVLISVWPPVRLPRLRLDWIILTNAFFSHNNQQKIAIFINASSIFGDRHSQRETFAYCDTAFCVYTTSNHIFVWILFFKFLLLLKCHLWPTNVACGDPVFGRQISKCRANNGFSYMKTFGVQIPTAHTHWW